MRDRQPIGGTKGYRACEHNLPELPLAFLAVCHPATACPLARSLQVLSLRKNQITGDLPADWDAPELEMLLLSDNQITGWGPGGAWCLRRRCTPSLASCVYYQPHRSYH